MNMKKVRGIISTILILSGLLSMVTGAVLYFMEYGMWLCFTRKFLNETHAISGLIMMMAMMVHFLINRHIYMDEIKALLPKRNNGGLFFCQKRGRSVP